MSRDTLWRCPVCGRLFSKPNQQHSHLSCNVEAHFKGKPEQIALFDALIARIEDLGPMRVDAVKTSINLIARGHFGGVRVLRGGLRLGFVLLRKLDSPRIVRSQWLGGDKYGHSVKIATSADLDIELLNWLREAYDLAAKLAKPSLDS